MEGYVASQRAVFIVDGEGVIRYKWVGESPLNEPDYDEVQQAAAALGG
jgi:peroxiredoxin